MKIDEDIHQCDCGCQKIAPCEEFLLGKDLDGVIRTVMHDHAEARDIWPCERCFHWRMNRDYNLDNYNSSSIICRSCRSLNANKA